MSHSVTGTVKTIEANEGGWGKNSIMIGVTVKIQLTIPYIRMTDNGEGINDIKYHDVNVFYPPTEELPQIGDEVTVTVAPSDENVSIN